MRRNRAIKDREIKLNKKINAKPVVKTFGTRKRNFPILHEMSLVSIEDARPMQGDNGIVESEDSEASEESLLVDMSKKPQTSNLFSNVTDKKD